MARKRRLNPREETRINFAIRERVMHFSPTISPAPKDEEAREIESLRSAINILLETDDIVILQPKYMGSYCDIYLTKDINDTKFFSRRGYPVRTNVVSREALIEAVRPIWERFSWQDTACRVIQAELMPWAVLGRGLIVRDFGGHGICHRDHMTYVRDTGLNEIVSGLKDTTEYRQFIEDADALSKKELRSKYPDHIIKQYQALSAIAVPEVEAYERAIDIYQQQLDIYGAEGDVEFKPFNLLKTVYDNGKEDVGVSNVDGWHSVSDDTYFIINKFLDESVEDQIAKAYEWYDGLVSNNMEGVVVKPNVVWDAESVPMFKVRNNNYLQMIYGVQFLDKFDYYLGRRRVGRKMRCSRNEWNIAQTLLRIPMKDISPDNEEYVNLVTARILEEDFEATLDTRL
jgi:hypothetical protein